MKHRDSEKLVFELLETWSTFTHYAGESVKFKDSEDVHQARVRLRKLLTFGKLLSFEETEVYQTWRRLMHVLGEVRDLDVLLESSGTDTPVEQAFKDHVALQLQGKRLTLTETFQLILTPEFEATVRRFLAGLFARKLRRTDPEELIDAVAKPFRKRKKRYADVPRTKEHIKEMHKLRLSTKMYRYTTEYLKPYADIPNEASSLKSLQTALGEANDSYNLLERWQSFSPPRGMEGSRSNRIELLEEELRAKLEMLPI
ncbi:CHAD domain-containing protein [Exiguobacterium flavidum]|uniref:CHAD domain-containing protein n=1 Tax=Exiguobacterium flavidum TaxID=2184695 RepID=UPI000DF767C5|nr:CHAD domain-containing protein [Exiguobacterium flavidum]